MTSPSTFIKELMNETITQRYNTTVSEGDVSITWSFMVSIFAIGGLVGSMVCGWVLQYGRKRCLLLNNVFTIAGAVLMICSQPAKSFEMIMVARFIYGVNTGIGISAHTLYLIECSPRRLRTMLAVTVGIYVGLGKFTGQLLGIRQLLGSKDLWPWLLGFNGFLGLFQLLALLFLPESPRFLLLNRGDHEACDKAMALLWSNMDHHQEVEEMLQEKSTLEEACNYSVNELVRNSALRWQLVTLVITFICLQLCGINAVYFYSFEVFKEAGIQNSQLPYAALGTGLCEFFCSTCGFFIIEGTGKKVLLFRAYLGMSITLILLTVTLNLERYVTWMSYCSMILIFIFIMFICLGPIVVTVPLPGDLFSHSYKSAAFTVAYVINWVSLFVVGMVFPLMVKHLNRFCFLVFLFFCLVNALYLQFLVPEFSNRTPLEVAEEFDRIHARTKAPQKEFNKVSSETEVVHTTKL
ncbi:solute carrier family 2, facilitated glucose transporter member 9-like [Synchiropus splendidus]|uniref:solute carrier family 2, facilitated glucose transporter member 9-like n=1 Tax=Synchiropus splendidus TaxID=270530 RepID=UPI00237E8E61|nr:solute carrier family 2, facilitated glucose transporter member 9-like [Synchiropus splendidus]